MNRSPSDLAWWHFALTAGDQSERFDEVIGAAAMLAAAALDVLGRHELFFPARVEFSAEPGRKWTVPVPSASEAALETMLLEAGPSLNSAHFRGTGLVNLVDGRTERVDDPVALTLYVRVGVAVEVSTDLDVWLPYDLKAEPQRELSDRNRPRLRAALEELAGLGVDVGDSETTRWAVVEGLHVRNHMNLFGQPSAVL